MYLAERRHVVHSDGKINPGLEEPECSTGRCTGTQVIDCRRRAGDGPACGNRGSPKKAPGQPRSGEASWGTGGRILG